MGSWEEGGGRALRETTSCRTQKESHVCYVMAGLGHPTLPSQFPHPRLPPSPAPPTVSPACASLLGVSLELQVADSWFKSLPPCCSSALLESRVNLALFVFSIIVGFAFLVVVVVVVLVRGSHSSLSQPPSRS